MIVVLTGAPGAGKGTQADLLVERLKFRKVSTGDALRRHIKNKTEVGLLAEKIMAEGRLVPDDVLFDLLRIELGDNPQELVLLDGYPRNVKQAETLSKLGKVHPVLAAIHLDVARDELLSRLSGRRVCSGCGKSYHISMDPPKKNGVCDVCGSELTQRVDDKAEKVAVRLNVYENETSPVLDFYKQCGLYVRVEGQGLQENVFKDIQKVLAPVLAKKKLS